LRKRTDAESITAVFLCVLAVFFAACKSAPQGVPVKPLDLMEAGSSFYIKMPAETDPELVKRVLQSSVEGLNDEDAGKIAERITVIYTGLERKRNETLVQAVVSGNVPQIAATKLLKKRKDWEEASVYAKTADASREYIYFTKRDSGLKVAFPSNTLACLGCSVPVMLADYDNHAFNGDESHHIDDTVYEWLNGGGQQIRFYAVKPQSFLTILTGANLNLKLSYAKGFLVTDKGQNDQYLMTIEFEFNDVRMVKAGAGLLSLAFGLTNSQTQLTTPTHIVVSDIIINKKQLYKLFLL